MCHVIVMSTTSDEDFSNLCLGSDITLSRPEHPIDREAASQLSYAEQWVVSRFGACGCHFRHDLDGDGFAPPVDWIHEDSDDIEATGQIYDLALRILASGHRLDILDVWEGSTSTLRVMEVDLPDVPRSHFRFIEGFHIKMRLGASESST